MNRTRTSKNAKRLLVWLLTLTMVFGLLPMAAFADEAVVEPVVEESVQETEPSSEPTPAEPSEEPEEPSKPTQEPEEDPMDEPTDDADVTIEGDEEQPEDEGNDEVILDDYWLYPQPMGISELASTGDFMKIMFLDCGRKYFSVDNIKKLIDNASAAGFNYIQLAVGNDGLRFLLDDMKITVNGTTYDSDKVRAAIHTGNEAYYDFDVDELTQSEMDIIIKYANDKGMGVIPCVNTPGHMDAILSAATALTGTDCSYSGSARTIDVTKTTAVAFTQALLQKYIDYFAGKGCKLFNMGADEYANDKFASGSMGFGNLQSTRKYSYYVQYVNQVAALIKNAGMKPMAFNDGIYFNSNTSSGTFDTDILICYWSSGWSGYTPMPASTLSSMGFKLINTHGDYYWVLGKADAQCDSKKAAGFNKTDFPGGTINNPSGAMFCIWCDYPGADTAENVVSNTADTIKAFGATLPQTTPVDPGTGGGTEETGEVVKVTVVVGGEYTDAITGDVRDTFKQCEDTSVATASVENGKADKTETQLENIVPDGSNYTGVISDGNGHYMVINNGTISSTTDINAATEFTVTSHYSGYYYTISANGYYLYVNWKNELQAYTYETYFQYNKGFVSGSYRIIYNSTETGGYWGLSTNSNDTNTGRLYKVTTTTTKVDATVITIKGVAEGSTTCKLGNKTYEITVTAEDLTKVTPLKLEYWITNGRISSVNGVTSETRTNLKNETYEVYFTNILATVDNIASAEGIDVLKNIAPDSTEYESRDVYYWHCRMLDTTKSNSSSSGTERQTNDGGDDDTTSGVSFTKIRYYNGEWEVYTENYKWVAVDTSKHQLVAYYREHIKVSDEVESYAADWGNRGDGSKGGWLDTNYYCTLSMQVVYEDNTTNPISTSAADLKSKTIIYGYWNNEGGRGIGTVMLDGKEYEIYKVTSETGAATVSFSGTNGTVTNFDWDNNETTVWEGDATDSVTIHNPSKGYSTDGANANLCWDENKEAILLRVYIRAKDTPDTLTVHYVDRTNADKPNEFYSYNISVAEGVTFSDKFARTSDGALTGNTVVNINNVTQTILYDLKQMKEIGAQYRYASFKFVDAERKNDGERAGKDVYLYYTFNRDKTFVVDFGIPLVITPAAINNALAGANITGVDVSSTSYADITADADWNITYALKKTLDKSDTFSARYTGWKYNDKNEKVDDEVKYTVEIIPASSVYYEESFATFTGGKNTASAAQWTNDSDGTAQSANQQLSALGSKVIYGYDEAYESSSKFSLGTAKKVTITSNMLNDWTGDSAWPTATFTFEGTGFDVISLTSNTTAAIAVNLVGTTANGEQVSKKYMVNTYYGYKYNDTTQKWEVDKSSTDTLYQIPVIAVKGLDYGKYTVTIMPFYNAAFDMQGNNTNDFWLDAIRVYDPLGKDYTRYTADQEGYPQYIKLRDKVADGEAAADNDVLFIDGADKAKVEKYKNYGPNNEVYLANGQAISFKLPANTNIATVQIGAKSPNASGTSKPTMSVSINDAKVYEDAIGTATEMYYKISESGADAQQVIITNTGDAILSLTNIKITYSKTSTTELAALSEGDEQAAVAAVRALYAAPVVEPVEPFKPERFETSWSSNVRKGSRAVLTVKASTDVDAIVVNGVTVTQFKTRTERIGYGWNAKRVTYREFSYMMTANEVGTINIPVVAVSNDLGSSAAYDSTLTVKPSSPIRDWIGGLFGRWF